MRQNHFRPCTLAEPVSASVGLDSIADISRISFLIWSLHYLSGNAHMNGRKFFGGALVIAVMIGGLIAPCAETSVAPEPGDLRAAGTVDFPVSCAPVVRAEFIRGIALLHSFFYEEARRIFTAVAEKDPTCAMAQWGIAMTWWHPIWTPPTPNEMRAGKAASDKAMAWNRSRAAVYRGAQCLLQHVEWSCDGSGRTVLSWAGGVARTGGRL